jgi:hypothetical protein
MNVAIVDPLRPARRWRVADPGDRHEVVEELDVTDVEALEHGKALLQLLHGAGEVHVVVADLAVVATELVEPSSESGAVPVVHSGACGAAAHPAGQVVVADELIHASLATQAGHNGFQLIHTDG